MNDKEFDKLKKELLPIELQDYFAKNREMVDNNIGKFEDIENELSKVGGTEEGKAIVRYVLDLAKEQYRNLNDQLTHDEMIYTASIILRKRIENIETALSQQGIKIDGLLKYEKGLKFVDDYIKRSSGDSSLE